MRVSLRPILSMLALGCMLLLGCRADDQVVVLKSIFESSSRAYDLSFEGVQSLPRQVLVKAATIELEEYEANGLRPSSIDDAAFSMQILYHKRGFPFAEVSYNIARPEGGKPGVTIRVDEGPRIVVESIDFVGATTLTSDELKSHVGGPTTQAFGLGELYFVQGEVDRAATSIESLYYQQGFLNVRVDEPQVTFDREQRVARLRYQVTEGTHFQVIRVVIEPPDLAREFALGQGLEGYVGANFYPRITHELRSLCSSRLANRGFADADCQASEEIDDKTGEVIITLKAVPGERIRARTIQVEGNAATRTSYILSQISLQPGALYSRGAERRSFRNLYASGLFSSVKMTLLGDGDQRDVLVEVEEAATLSTSLEVGYGAYERARIILGVTEKSLFGTGRSLTFRGKIAERARGAKLFLSDPYTIDRDHVLGATAFIEQRELVSFNSQEVGAGLNLTQHITDNFRAVYGHEYRISEAGSIDVELPGLDPSLKNDVNISALYLTSIYDTRDNFLLPKSGSWFRLRNEVAGSSLGSQLDFLRFDGRIAHYLPITEGQQIAMHVRAGVIIPTEDTDVIPLQERFFNGGQNTVRSFREDELGPTDVNGKPIGGEAYSMFSIEYRRKLLQSISGALFIDAGNVTLSHSDALRFADMRYGVGPGLRWMLPIGPLRLDWGINPNPREFERRWVLQFSLGVAF